MARHPHPGDGAFHQLRLSPARAPVSLPKVIEVAKSMGLSDPTLNPSNPSLVIGTETVRPIEMAAAYATVPHDRGVTTTLRPLSTASSTAVAISSITASGRAAASFWRQSRRYSHCKRPSAVRHRHRGRACKRRRRREDRYHRKQCRRLVDGITPTLVSSVWIGDPNGELPMYVDGVEVYRAGSPHRDLGHDVMAYALSTTPWAGLSCSSAVPHACPRVHRLTDSRGR